ncbi:MAG: spore coat protein CotH [Planctomycetes bacterium]|nr:spore coat protein CotH [Planctomycetota bacterium]
MSSRRLIPARVAAALVVALALVRMTPGQPPSGRDGLVPSSGPGGSFGPGFGGPGGGFGGFGGPGGGDIALVDELDADGNGRLDGEERTAAREAARARRRGGGGPRGFGGPRGTPQPGPRVAPADVAGGGDADLYDTGVLRTLFLDFATDDWEEELADFYGTDVDVPARLSVDGRVIEGVGVHFRGASSYFSVPAGWKRSLNVSIDHTDPEADLLGYRTLNLLNANSDPSLMSTVLYSHIAGEYLPTPRANFVRFVINGECWGVYVNVQQADKTFFRERFGSSKGHRWKVRGSPGGRGGLEYFGDDPKAYRRVFEIKSKDTDAAWRDLIDLCRIIHDTPLQRLEEALRPRLDIDGVLWFLALDTALLNSDGYWTRASDYTLFEDAAGVFHLVPHDMNEAFGLARMGGPPGGFAGGPGGPRGPGDGGVALDPLVAIDDPGKPLRAGLLGIPTLRERYLDHVRTIARDRLDWEVVGPLVARWRALIEDAVRADTRKLSSTEAFLAVTAPGPVPPEADRSATLRELVERRRTFLLEYRDPNGGSASADPAGSSTR